ncbi:MAG: hypothetical protein AAF196_17010 [Planctomycetota bacterium]
MPEKKDISVDFYAVRFDGEEPIQALHKLLSRAGRADDEHKILGDVCRICDLSKKKNGELWIGNARRTHLNGPLPLRSRIGESEADRLDFDEDEGLGYETAFALSFAYQRPIIAIQRHRGGVAARALAPLLGKYHDGRDGLVFDRVLNADARDVIDSMHRVRGLTVTVAAASADSRISDEESVGGSIVKSEEIGAETVEITWKAGRGESLERKGVLGCLSSAAQKAGLRKVAILGQYHENSSEQVINLLNLGLTYQLPAKIIDREISFEERIKVVKKAFDKVNPVLLHQYPK